MATRRDALLDGAVLASAIAGTLMRYVSAVIGTIHATLPSHEEAR